jgi:hypothetical protein
VLLNCLRLQLKRGQVLTHVAFFRPAGEEERAVAEEAAAEATMDAAVEGLLTPDGAAPGILPHAPDATDSITAEAATHWVDDEASKKSVQVLGCVGAGP